MNQVIPTRGDRPVRSMPAAQFDRSVDTIGTQPAGGPGFEPPLWLKKASTTEVKVTSATVNGITPTGIGANIDVSGADGTWFVYLHATLGADGIPTAVAVVASTSAIPADGNNDAYIQIGTVLVSAGVISSVSPTLAWSQTFVACGRNMDADPAIPGTYYWQVA